MVGGPAGTGEPDRIVYGPPILLPLPRPALPPHTRLLGGYSIEAESGVQTSQQASPFLEGQRDHALPKATQPLLGASQGFARMRFPVTRGVMLPWG